MALTFSFLLVHTRVHYVDCDGISTSDANEEGSKVVTELDCMTTAREACLAIRPHLDRVDILLYAGPLELLLPLPSASSMQYLRLFNIPSEVLPDAPSAPSIFQHTPPQLRRFILKGTQMVENVFLHVRPGKIQSLEIDHISGHDGSLDFVLQCTQLRTLLIGANPLPLDMSRTRADMRVQLHSISRLTIRGNMLQLYSQIASAPNLLHLALRGCAQPALPPSHSTISTWPAFRHLVTLEIELQDSEVAYLIPTLERCPDLLAMQVQGPSGFKRLLQRLNLQHTNDTRREPHNAGAADRLNHSSQLCPKLRLLRMWAEDEHGVERVTDADAAMERETCAFSDVWPLTQHMLVLRPHLDVWIWTEGAIPEVPSLWSAEEVEALTGTVVHTYGDRLHVLGPSESDSDCIPEYPASLSAALDQILKLA